MSDPLDDPWIENLSTKVDRIAASSIEEVGAAPNRVEGAPQGREFRGSHRAIPFFPFDSSAIPSDLLGGRLYFILSLGIRGGVVCALGC